MARKKECMDGNTAAAHVAHATNEVIAIYPITPSSPMGEISDAKSAANQPNIWGTIPSVSELQSEGGASGAVHGALTSGALTTTFTASQGLLLMIPNMYKIAGELTSTVFHVTARALACQGLSIFGDHSDVMAVRQTGFAMLCSNTVQEVMDFALIAQKATLTSRVPFVHFFDGFRTSHEIQKIEVLDYEDMKKMIPFDLVLENRKRGLCPDRPSMRGTAQNPDVYFQGRETVNKYYEACPQLVQDAMDEFAKIVGRQYKVYEYVGHPEAENVVVAMGSGAGTMEEVVTALAKQGKKVGLVKVRLFRPFAGSLFAAALPASVKRVAVLDRTKEPGSQGEPLYEDVCSAIAEAVQTGKAKFAMPVIVGGRYGLGSKEFTDAMCKGILDNLEAKEPKNHFTIGINDDVMGTSLPYDPAWQAEENTDTYCAMFYGLGSDGTVGANKNSIKIIGNYTDNYAQGYFVYDSKKAGGLTTSHLRFGKNPIASAYLITKADFIACHQYSFLEKYDMLSNLKEGGTFLVSSLYDTAEETWQHLPKKVQEQLIQKKARFFTVNAIKEAEKIGLGSRTNTILQTAFFMISKVMDPETAVAKIREYIVKSYSKKGEAVVAMNNKAVDAGLQAVSEMPKDKMVVNTEKPMKPAVPADAPEFVQKVTGVMIAGNGNDLPVSAMPVDGTFPTATTQYEKRNIAVNIPVWDPNTCIQCGMCSLYCPHAAIRIKAYEPKAAEGAPETFKSTDAKTPAFAGLKFTVQIAPEDCTGCGACVEMCPAKSKTEEGKKAINMQKQEPLREAEAKNYAFFLNLPETKAELANPTTVKGSQLRRPLFEYSGACAGCGETPYVKLLSQLFGDRAMIANATGCSSIYGGNLPTTPYCQRADGRGPAWSNSLFEDNAEFGLGMRLGVDKFKGFALELIDKLLACECSAECKPLLEAIKNAPQTNQTEIEEQRARVAELKERLAKCDKQEAKQLYSLADYLVKKSVWILGGDGWAYDIGYGGLDHVIASGRNVNILVLDTEVYSNTGGQMSKATPLGAKALFAAGGKRMPKKDLGMIAMTYGNVYVASVSLGANPAQAVKAFNEAEAYDGPSLIICYAHCIAHGINMTTGLREQQKAVNSGAWLLYRYNPTLEQPLQLDSKAPTLPYAEYAFGENRFRQLKAQDPATAEALVEKGAKLMERRFKLYQKLSEIKLD